jgi:hypothetical protein
LAPPEHDLSEAPFVSSERNSVVETAATPSIEREMRLQLAFDGLLKPLILRTYCSDAARISASVTGGAKLKSNLDISDMNVSSAGSRVAGRHDAGILHHQDHRALRGAGSMVHALRHDEALSRSKLDRPALEIDDEATLDHEKELVVSSCLCQ